MCQITVSKKVLSDYALMKSSELRSRAKQALSRADKREHRQRKQL